MDRTFWTALQPILAQAARDGLRLIGASLMTHGFIANGAGVEAFIGAGMTLAGLFWGWWTTSGYLQAGALLQKLTASRNHTDAVEKAQAMPPASATVVATAIATKVSAVLLAVMLAGLLAWPGDARAQVRMKTPQQIKQDVDNFIDSPATTIENTLQSALSKPMQDLQTFLQSDLAGAASLATQIPAVQDGNGQACWSMLQGASAVFKAHPVPVTLKLATDIEAARLLVITANKICQYSQCTQVFNELSNSIKTIAPMSLSVPSITSLCSQVPQIAVVAPIPVSASAPVAATVPVVTPVPTPTPDLTK